MRVTTTLPNGKEVAITIVYDSKHVHLRVFETDERLPDTIIGTYICDLQTIVDTIMLNSNTVLPACFRGKITDSEILCHVPTTQDTSKCLDCNIRSIHSNTTEVPRPHLRRVPQDVQEQVDAINRALTQPIIPTLEPFEAGEIPPPQRRHVVTTEDLIAEIHEHHPLPTTDDFEF